MAASQTLERLVPSANSTSDVKKLAQNCYDALNDDFNTAIAIANLFEAVRIINSVNAGTESISADDLALLRKTYADFVFGILGFKAEEAGNSGDLDGLMQFVLRLRAEAKDRKDFTTSDEIRDELNKLGFEIKDTKDAATWSKGA